MRRRSLSGLALLLTLGAFLIPTSAQGAESRVRNGVGANAQAADRSATTIDTSTRHFITFDTGTSPCAFDSTAADPLRGQYSGLGVRFRGPTASTGGAILNQCANFGIRARTGQEFLAFNDVTYARPPESMLFDRLQRSVQLYVANGSPGGQSTYTLVGWRSGNVVARTSITTDLAGWVLLRVAASGMDRVTLRAATPDGAFVVDDLQYTSVT